MENIKTQVNRCLRDNVAACMQSCYFNLDIRDFISRLQRGRFDAALRILRDAVAFPGIVAALCDAPCQGNCIRGEYDNAVRINLLEQTVLQHAKNKTPARYNVAAKQGKIGIVGGGISGLTCALRLATRKYDVTVIEKTDRIGGHLHDLIPSDKLISELQHEFQHENWQLKLNTRVEKLEGLGFDAVYIATGKGGDSFGLSLDGRGVLPSELKGVFLGGSLLGCNTMEAIRHGLQAANQFEAYLKTGRMSSVVAEGKNVCTKVDAWLFQPMEFVQTNEFNADEAELEAKRCIRCNCDLCQGYCELSAYFNKYPKRIVDEVESTLNPSSYFYNRVATRLIASCLQCSICKDACPENIDMQSFLLESRREMVRKGDMPEIYSAFWLEDMAHADGQEAALLHLPDGHTGCKSVFFPGCQLGASNPDYVLSAYKALTDIDTDTGLLLRCCAAPAHWAGAVDLHMKMVEDIRRQWEQIGKPTFIFACPTCKKMFSEFLPEIKGEFLYERLELLPADAMNVMRGKVVSVFDPCSSRGEPELQSAVRRLLEKAGYILSPLPKELSDAQCCSFGGQTAIANPKAARNAVEKRVTQSPNPYVTYCSNCCDTFTAAGKSSEHILGLLFGSGDFERSAATWSQRRQNRLDLKTAFTAKHREGENDLPLVEISQSLKQKISDLYLLEEDCIKTLFHCEQSEQKLYDEQRDAFVGHLLIGYVTHWVEYRRAGSGFILLNAYAHRMQIQGG